MKNLFKGLTVIGLAALMVGCGAANAVNNTNTSEKIEQKTTNTVTKKENTAELTNTSVQTNSELLNKYAAGTYCVAVDGMRARASATTNSDVVQSSFQKGVSLNIVEVKTGDDDADSVWGRVETPFQGWICLQDGNMQYLMTKDEYAQSGIKTDASPVTAEGSIQGIGSGVYDDLGNYVNHTYKVVADELNVRDAASTSGKQVSTMHEGDEVYVGQVKMNEEDGSIWALVNDGWVCIHDQQGNWYMQMQ